MTEYYRVTFRLIEKPVRRAEWTPRLAPRLIVQRAIALLALTLGATAFYIPAFEWQAGLALSAITAALIGIVLWACELLPSEGTGRIDEGQRR
jgi:hypothetical protein